MFDNIWPALIYCTLFGASVYYINQTKSCECAAVDPVGRSYILGFSYFAIIYSLILMVIGKSLIHILFSYPIPTVIFMVLLAAGSITWAIYTLKYISALRSCKCTDSIAEEISYIYAIIDLITAAIFFLGLIYAGYSYSQMTPVVRASIYKAIANATKKI